LKLRMGRMTKLGGIFLLLLGMKMVSAEYKEVLPGIYSFSVDGGFTISVFVVTGNGVVATDPMNPRHAKAMIEAIKEVTNEPIKYLIHTHNHWDHAGGNGLFRDEGAKILAHEDAVEWMEENRNPNVVVPDTQWRGEEYVFSLGNQTFEFYGLGNSHGVGSFAILMPNEKFMFLADFLLVGALPPADFNDSNVREAIEYMEKLLRLYWDTAIHTHSTMGQDALNLTTRKDFERALQYLKDLTAAVKKEIETNPNFFAIANSIDLPEYKDLNFYNEFISLNAWKVLFEQEIGPYSWRPRKGRSVRRRGSFSG